MQLRTACIIGLATLAGTAAADIQTTVETAPVAIRDPKGQEVRQDIDIVTWRDDQAKPTGYVIVFAHGKPIGSASYSNRIWIRGHEDAIKTLAELGHTVLMPMRIGQGDRRGPIVEQTACEGVPHKVGFEIVADQLEQVIRWRQLDPRYKGSKFILVGHSMGGASVLALASRNLESLSAVVNFAGGNGGNPQSRPRNPCDADDLARTLGDYGKTAKAPSLWIYANNDYYWGKELPVQWARLYKGNGGNVDFNQVDSGILEGHDFFRKNPKAWLPLVKNFFQTLVK